jgi:hypothetical protein
MCWNATVSMNTFLFSMFAVGLAKLNGVVTTPGASFYSLFASMQLIEYFLWSQPANNAFWSKVGLAIVLLQPFVSLTRISDPMHRNAALAAAALTLCVVLTVVKPLGTIDFSSVRAPNGHLAWNWLKFPAYVFAIYVAFQLFSKVYNGEYVFAALEAAIIFGIYLTYRESGTWGSMWCWIANVYGLWLLYMVAKKSSC